MNYPLQGGMLYKPPRRLSEACAPLSPLAFNDMWLWSQKGPAIHTLVVGAARPTDFDEHVDGTPLSFTSLVH
jgi:predicted aldo/keto reductase-like oxidoreductase